VFRLTVALRERSTAGVLVDTDIRERGLDVDFQPDREYLHASLVTIYGECVTAYPYKGGYRFDFAVDHPDYPPVVDVRIGRDIAPERDGFIEGVGLPDVLTVGSAATVSGVLRSEHEDSDVYLSATEVRPTGELGAWARGLRFAVEGLLTSRGNPDRLLGSDIHCRDFEAAPWPRPISTVTLLSSAHSSTRADVLAAVEPVITRKNLTLERPDGIVVSGSDAIASLVAALTAVDAESTQLVLIVRGGGDWLSLRPFDSEELARAVQGCAVPVFTAIGESHNTTLVDRAATMSFTTALALGNALAAELDAQPGQPRGARFGRRKPRSS
jgi:hypothetical protein